MLTPNQNPQVLGLELTEHAQQRMQDRNVRLEELSICILRGRQVWCRGSILYVMGRRELGDRLPDARGVRALMGLHVVCSHAGAILTVFRDRRRLLLRDTKYGQGPAARRQRRWRQATARRAAAAFRQLPEAA